MWPIRNGGGEALMHVVIDLCIALIGPGALSLDRSLQVPFVAGAVAQRK
jgi:hypothetical protein